MITAFVSALFGGVKKGHITVRVPKLGGPRDDLLSQQASVPSLNFCATQPVNRKHHNKLTVSRVEYFPHTLFNQKKGRLHLNNHNPRRYGNKEKKGKDNTTTRASYSTMSRYGVLVMGPAGSGKVGLFLSLRPLTISFRHLSPMVATASLIRLLTLSIPTEYILLSTHLTFTEYEARMYVRDWAWKPMGESV